MSAILFGSIGTIADTSELQRQAYNEAFQAHGLQWRWDQEDYRAMLGQSGGRDRVASYASSRGEQVDADAVHQTKSDIFQASLAQAPPSPRDGVVDTVRRAKDDGVKVALVTTTSEANISALMEAMAPALARSDFDLVVDSSNVDEAKPDPASYRFALDRLGEPSGGCVAIEDNVGGIQAAAAAGIRCLAFPNQNTAGHDFDAADSQVGEIDFGDLQQQLGAQ